MGIALSKDRDFLLGRWAVSARARRLVATLVVAFLLGSPAGAIADQCVARPDGTSAALYALLTTDGAASCGLEQCDADADGAVTTTDVDALLRSAVGLGEQRDCANDQPSVCGRPVSEAAAPDLADAVTILGSAVAGSVCVHAECDVDGSGSIASRDALRVLSASLSPNPVVPELCEPREIRVAGTRPVPGENGCVSALNFERCRLRAAGGPTRSARLRCAGSSDADDSLEFGTDEIAVFLDDADGRCFETVVSPDQCRVRSDSIVCVSPNPAIDRIQIRRKRRDPRRFTATFRAADNIPCLSASASPWVVGMAIGDDCNDVGCPVDRKRPVCPGTCGDYNSDPGEQCDDGPEGSIECSPTCVTLPFCGDREVNQPSEECDDGRNTSSCDSDCTAAACGDDFLNAVAGETCDDGNIVAGDGCSTTCQLEFCGNGVLDPGEFCDDAMSGSATCDRDCTEVACGDGLANPAAGEECDLDAFAPGLDCSDFGFDEGELGCDQSSCLAELDGCVNFAEICEVTFTVPDSALLGALQFETQYASAEGSFVGSRDLVDCEGLAPGGLIATFNDIDAEKRLAAGMITLSGIPTPSDVARCAFGAVGTSPVPSDFPVTVVDASGIDFTPLSVSVAVSDVDCSPVTTSTTSTTLPTAERYIVDIRLEDAKTFGALQFDVDYSAAAGGFAGAADSVECSGWPAGAIAVANNDVAALTLRAGIISLSGFSGPSTVVSCVFDPAVGAPAPVTGDFIITVVDASTPDLTPTTATVSIGAITAE